MIFEVYPAGVYQANCYILGDEKTNEGFIVDPGGDAKGILNLCRNVGINKIKAIILTHGHFDHIGGVDEIKEETGCSVLMSQRDDFLLSEESRNMIPILRNTKIFKPDGYLKEGDILKLSDIEIKVIETPGHTPGGLSFAFSDTVLTGDTLFKTSIGRTDFKGSSREDIISSIKNKLFKLSDETKICPGHGPFSSIGYEKKYNPFIK